VPTPERSEELRQQGVDLPDVSAESADPRGHSDFIDRRLEAVGFGIYLGGYHLYCEGLALPVFLPNDWVDLSLTNAEPVNLAIYPDRASAMQAVPYGPQQPGQPEPYAYFRGVGGLIFPTVVSPATAPRTHETMLAAMKQLGEEVSEELAVVALTIIGGRVLQQVYNRLVRVGQTEPLPRGGTKGEKKGNTKGSAPAKSPAELGKEIGTEVRSMQTGKRAAIASKVTQANLSQADAATATGEASIAAFGRIGGTVKLPNGDLVVPSVQVGQSQPIFVVKPNGQVLPAKATISVPEPINLANPIRITDVKIE
jgi:hypothetical protein